MKINLEKINIPSCKIKIRYFGGDQRSGWYSVIDSIKNLQICFRCQINNIIYAKILAKHYDRKIDLYFDFILNFRNYF